MFKRILFVAISVLLIASAFSKPTYKRQDGNCPNAQAQLQQGNIAVVTVQDGETLNLRVQPALDASRITKIPKYEYATVIAGPICNGGYRWYEIGWQGKDGWSAEVGPDGVYNMIPNGQPVPNTNPDSISTPGGLTEQYSNPNDSGDAGMYYQPGCGYDPGFCPSGDCGPQLYQYTPNDNIQVYIVVDCQLRQVLTDSTLRALGIPSIYPDMPQATELGLPFGPDIPFADGQETEFCAFKNKYFRSIKPVNGALDCSSMVQQQIAPTATFTPQPLVEAPIETTAIEEPFFCNWWVVGWLACDLAEANTVDARCEPQCMTLMRDKDHRPDMNQWSRGTGNSSPVDVLTNAEKEKPYTDQITGKSMQVRVRQSNESPQNGDLIIWQPGCGGSDKDVGHIGEVESSAGITVNIDDSNWDDKCSERKNVQIQVLSCMRFVTKPFPEGTYIPSPPAVTNCGDYQGWQNFSCNYIPWWKP